MQITRFEPLRGRGGRLPWTRTRPLVLIAGACALAYAQLGAAAPSQSDLSFRIMGSSTIHGGPAGPSAVATPETRDDVDGSVRAQTPGAAPSTRSATVTSGGDHRFSSLAIPSKVAGRAGLAFTRAPARASAAFSALPPPPTTNPNPEGRFVRDASGTTFGFNGLTHFDQRTAGTGVYTNTQFSLEPPDQGLCAGNGFVVEAINNAIAVYDRHGTPLTGPEALSQFWGLAPEVDRTTLVFGPFISDPKCAYDPESGRWFVSELMQDNGTNPGATGRNYNLLAISQTSDPTGAFVVIAYDVTDDGLNGTPAHPGCPCFGDQPLLGFNEFGVYQSTNEFGASVFNGSQVYAISKKGLIAVADGGDPSQIHGVAIDAGALPAPSGGTWYSIQPAVASSHHEDDEDEDGRRRGTEFFLSALQFGLPPYAVLDNRIAVWALTNTRSLARKSPKVGLSVQVIASETYGQPNPAQQKPGPAGSTPLADSLGDPLELINTNDDRMNQVVFADGVLYGSVNTIIGDGSRTGIAWFGVAPRVRHHDVSGRVVRQGYVAVDGENVIYPSIASTGDDESAVMVFTLVGPDYFPSAAYVSLADEDSAVRIAANGAGPDDGFSGYPQFGGPGFGRWGDYSAAVSDGERIWIATEYIPNSPRTLLANWGSWIARIHTDDEND